MCAIETCRALRAGFWSYGNGRACGFSPRRTVQKVDSGGLRQRNLGVFAKTCFSMKISCWSLHTCARQGRARQSGVLSTGWTGYQETGVAHNIHQAGAKVGVLFGVRWTGGNSPAAQPPAVPTIGVHGFETHGHPQVCRRGMQPFAHSALKYSEFWLKRGPSMRCPHRAISRNRTILSKGGKSPGMVTFPRAPYKKAQCGAARHGLGVNPY